MFRNIQRVLVGMMMLLVLAANLMPAFAQAPAWNPTFDPSVHVYVDPALKNHPSFPIEFRSMSSELVKLQKQHNLKVYVVATEQVFDPSRVIAKEFVDQYVARWQGRADFPKDDFLVIVWVRQGTDPNKGSVAAYPGNRLVAYGYNGSKMSDKVNGPVTPALKQFMPRDPEQAMLQIVRNVNTGVTNKIAADAQAERDRIENARRAEERRIEDARTAEQRRIEAEKQAIIDAENAKQMQFYAMIGIPSLLVLGLFGFLFFRFRSAKARAEAAIGSWQEKFGKSNANYIELQAEYRPFLVSQGTDWKSKFKNKTLEVYTAAVGNFANLSAQNEVAKGLLKQAQAESAKANIFSIAGAEKAVALLTSETVIVTGDKIPVEDRDYFGSEVKEEHFTPQGLLDSMGDLFTKTGQSLASIMKTLDGANKNREEIEAITRSVDALRVRMTEKELSFAPYEMRYKKILADQQAFLDILTSDPLSAFADSEKVEADAEALKADIEQAIALKDQLAGTEAELVKARKRVADTRALKVGFNYPEEGEVPAGAAGTFLLNEAGFNPDTLTDKSAKHLVDAHKALLDGELKKAGNEKAEASKAAAAAVALVESIVAAKAAVEKQVPEVRKNLGLLASELPDAGKDVDALKADFLAKNFTGEPEKLVKATKVNEATAAELAKVRIAYFEQRFIAAAKLIANTGSGVQGSRGLLVEIATRLKQLRDLRAHAKKVVAECEQSAGALKSKLANNAITTSKQTDDAYAQLLPTLRTQKTDVAKDITDWPAAATAADKLSADLKKVDSAIDEEKQAHALAGTRIAAVRTAVNDAASTVAHADTRNAARQKLEEAKQVLAQLEADYRVAKSDWKALARLADSKKTVADEAKRLALADQALAQTARDEINAVESRINGLRVRSWTQLASWGGQSQMISIPLMLDLSEATRYLGEASADLRNRDYEGASQAAKRADQAAAKAEAWANAQLALAVQEMVARWQEEQRRRDEEERRRREEEDRRRREEDDRRRREEEDRRRDDNSGGGNYGGGSSGGDNYGGGGSPPSSGGDNY